MGFDQKEEKTKVFCGIYFQSCINPLTSELNPSAQRCLTKFLTGDFSS
jgi:hypothetical protein